MSASSLLSGVSGLARAASGAGGAVRGALMAGGATLLDDLAGGLREGEVPCFWACGVTPQQALQSAKLPIAVTHSPGCMLVCDVLNADLAERRRERRALGIGAWGLFVVGVASGVALALAWEEWAGTGAGGDEIARQSLLPRILGRLVEVPLLGRVVA